VYARPTARERSSGMGKVLIGVLSGIFIGAVIYELLCRNNPELIRKMEELTSRNVDDFCDAKKKVQHN
jgi:hypothetical protein